MELNEPFLLFEKIKRARIEARLSQKELAKKIGVSSKTISAYETGRAIPPVFTLVKIAKAVDFPFDIFGNEVSNEGAKFKKLVQEIQVLEEQLAKVKNLVFKVMRKAR